MDIYKRIEKASVISFDVFDTLIKRNVDNPLDVFEIVQYKYNEKNKTAIKNFSKYRIKAEKIARDNCKTEEVQLDEIYEVLKNIYPNYDEDLKRIEIECEINICIKNYEVYKLYEYAIKKNKRVFIISDFYLSKDIVEDILRKNSINNYENIIVSSEFGLTKKSSNLFRKFVEDYNIDCNDMLHIGDHPVSDNIIPQQLGINSYSIHNKHHDWKYKIGRLKNKHLFNIDENILNEFIINKIKYREKEVSDNYKFGYENLGILYYGFLQNINDKANKFNAEKIYFFSRDGFVLKKAYEKSFLKDNDIDIDYFYISRRAVIVPSLIENYELKELVNLLGVRSKDTIKSFFNRVGLDINKYSNDLLLLQINKDDLFVINEKTLKMYNIIRDDIVKNAMKELEILNKYLVQEKMDKVKKCLIVDIGWRGSMQFSLEKILNKLKYNIEINGIYLGLNKKSEMFLKSGMKADGFLFSKENNYCLEADVSSGVGLIESLFLANHGSVIGYYESENVVKPQFSKYEYSDKDRLLITEIQQGAIDFVEDFHKMNMGLGIKISPKFAFNRILKVIKKPNKEYAKKFGDIGFSDYKDSYLAKPKSLFTYIIKIKDLKNDFIISQWKIGFMKRLFKIKLPYYKIYKILRKIFSE